MNPLTLVIRRIASADTLWSRLPNGLRQSPRFAVQRKAALEDRFAKRCTRLFNGATVLQGPFTGLAMPAAVTQGSAHLPRLTGTYESELHVRLEQFIAKRPPLFVDIGFAEGYYLVGCGRLSPATTLVGFDPAAEAHRLCRELAAANRLPLSRLQLHGACSREALQPWLPAPSLVLCDCEGFEVELFSPADATMWAQSDLIVECHDFIRLDAAAVVAAALAATHRITRVATVSPEDKLPLLNGAPFKDFTREEKLRLLSEGRPAKQVWLVAEANT